MDAAEKIEAAQKAKEKGTTYFKEEKFFLATRQYKNIVNYLKTEASKSSRYTCYDDIHFSYAYR